MRAGLELLEKGGLDALSLRGVAKALGMHAPGLYWYIEDKQELIDLMAKAILDEALDEGSGPADGEGWEPWLTEVAVNIRRVMLKRRDGARLVAGAYLFRTQSITQMLETAVGAMEEDGLGRDLALHGAITAMRYTMGIALDDQAEPRKRAEMIRQRLESGEQIGPKIDAERYPRVAEVMGRWMAQVFVPGVTPQEIGERHLRHGLALVMAGIRSAGRAKVGG
ncbi:MAG TPA: TetR/AcrR family transcriptional regulator C-terminal domain-containing protein [Gemmatimonadaceae bacterium]|nr:TetR/AcrR family transcriptional regulator C-terminal domain-containing protein [Gemmatimonadaceae bacterium]